MRIAGNAMVGLAALALPADGGAQGIDFGQREFMNSCVQCHGADGKGGGLLAGYLNTPPTDLTQLAKENGGVLPVAHLYEVIDGRAGLEAHGSREMPIWGLRYQREAPAMLGEYAGPEDRDIYVQARILALIEYISALQEE